MTRNDLIKTVYRKHRLHYLKWDLFHNEDMSVRYFFSNDNHPEYRRKFVLKSHKTKEYWIVDAKEASELITKFSKNDGKHTEVVSHRIGNNKYHRLHFDENVVERIIEGRRDKVLARCKLVPSIVDKLFKRR